MIKHVVICNNCGKEEKAIPPDGLFSNWRIPIGWKYYESKDFCCAKCVSDWILKNE